MSTMPPVINRFVDYYIALDSQPPSKLATLYDAHATLTDPFGVQQGLPAIERYFAHLLDNVEHCRFAIASIFGEEQRFAVTWTMDWAHPRIAAGKRLTLPGCSIVEIKDDRIFRQRDYYDAGEMIYQHLPILGWAVRGVKRRVRS